MYLKGIQSNRENGIEEVFQEIMAENFPELLKDKKKIHSQESSPNLKQKQ